tara:strand:+ start:2091 stop:2531 length:441 start_codon:yes stop_codon:yes gene_type:complete
VKKSDVFYVIARAVESYKAAAFRDRHGYIKRGYTAKQAVKKFPEYFALYSSGKVKFIGKSANQILEDYLQKLGHKPNSEHWYDLARQVVDLAAEEDSGDGEVTEKYFKGPKRQERYRSNKRTGLLLQRNRKVHNRRWSKKPKDSDK